MTLAEVKIEALRLMFINNNTELNIENIARLESDVNYGRYLVNMRGSINRAIDRIQNALVIEKEYEVKSEMLTDSLYGRVFDLKKIPDIYKFDRVCCFDGSKVDWNAGFTLASNKLRLSNGAEEYLIIYFPKLSKINEMTSDEDEFPDIPEHIVALIPLFVKGELWQEEEPALSADARNLFEQSLADLKINPTSRQTRIQGAIDLQ